jgi:predicted nucleic acid-binding protein
MTTIVDTDILIALADETDLLHDRALTVSQLLERQEAQLLISPTTLTEFSLVALKRLGLDVIRRSINKLTSGAIIVLDITEKDVIAATELFNGQSSKDESLCDCFVMALAKRTGARYIFSFDQGYPKNNFMLAEAFLAPHT